jgi:hypothetical protein
MKRSLRSLKTVPNSFESLHRLLDMYALAASAAGVGLVAVAQPAEAKIVYTPSNIPIHVNGGVVELDLNHDGIKDFQFYASYQGPGIPELGEHGSALTVQPVQQSNRVRTVESKGHLCAAALPKGDEVGGRSRFQPGHSSLVMAFAGGDYTSNTAFGPWLKVKQAYLGFKFVIKGKIHFGWARIRRVSSNVGFPAIITGYAYETIPDEPIITGRTEADDEVGVEQLNPASLGALTLGQRSLGLLAMGSSGLSIWRREEATPERNGFLVKDWI